MRCRASANWRVTRDNCCGLSYRCCSRRSTVGVRFSAPNETSRSDVEFSTVPTSYPGLSCIIHNRGSLYKGGYYGASPVGADWFAGSCDWHGDVAYLRYSGGGSEEEFPCHRGCGTQRRGKLL